jgi:class 3 adenylate cyclase
VSHLEQAWEDPAYARFLHRLASFSRLILLDKRGTGLSDRVSSMPTLEQRMDDVRAVMDATNSKRAALFGISEGGPMSVLFAATYPDRTAALILYGSIARMAWAPDFLIGDKPGSEDWMEGWRTQWGTPYLLDEWAPSAAHDQPFREWWAKYLRFSASPSAVINLFRMNSEIDVRSVLPTIQVPSLVLHRVGDRAIGVEHGRYLAANIPGATLVELVGDDHLWWVGDSEAIVNEIQEFLTGQRDIVESDRVLATVLFTDIVDSTRHAAAMGDRRWRDVIDSHNAVVEKEISRFHGRAIKNTGDGFLATFDGPGRAIRCAFAINEDIQKLGIQVRAGLHTGEIEQIGDEVGGIAVHIASRVMAQANASEVWASGTVKDLVVGSKLKFSDRGSHRLKGVPEEWRLFSVEQ